MPRLEPIAYAVAALLVLGAGWWLVDLIGDRRQAAIEERIREATKATQDELDAVQEKLRTAEGEARALATRLADSRKEIEDEIRMDPDACRLPDGLRERLEQRWAPVPAR